MSQKNKDKNMKKKEKGNKNPYGNCNAVDHIRHFLQYQNSSWVTIRRKLFVYQFQDRIYCTCTHYM